MNISTNYSFKKPTLSDSANIEDVSDAIEAIDNTIKSVEDANLVQTPTGSPNAIILSLPTTLSNGYQVTFVANANNSGSATTINSTYPLYKPATTTAPTLISSKAYTIWYNSTNNCFFLKASATGTVTSEKVLAGETYSTEVDTDLVGSMINNGAITYTITSAGGTYTIPIGYHNGLGVITAPSLATVTSGGTITSASQILSGYKCYSDGALYTGTMGNYSTADQVTDSCTYSGTTIKLSIPNTGYYSDTYNITYTDADFIASNIISGKNIFGLDGTATIASLGGAQYSSGTFYRDNSYVTVSLPFTPDMVITAKSTGYDLIVSTNLSNWYYKGIYAKVDTEVVWKSVTPAYIDLITNGFYWHATGGYGDTYNYVAIKF